MLLWHQGSHMQLPSEEVFDCRFNKTMIVESMHAVNIPIIILVID